MVKLDLSALTNTNEEQNKSSLQAEVTTKTEEKTTDTSKQDTSANMPISKNEDGKENNKVQEKKQNTIQLVQKGEKKEKIHDDIPKKQGKVSDSPDELFLNYESEMDSVNFNPKELLDTKLGAIASRKYSKIAIASTILVVTTMISVGTYIYLDTQKTLKSAKANIMEYDSNTQVKLENTTSPESVSENNEKKEQANTYKKNPSTEHIQKVLKEKIENGENIY